MQRTRTVASPPYAQARATASRWLYVAYAAAALWAAVHTAHLFGAAPTPALTAANLALLLPLARYAHQVGWCGGWYDRGWWQIRTAVADAQQRAAA